jgi:hypothetical protein
MLTQIAEMPNIGKEMITPGLAQAILGLNHRNRKIDPDRVDHFVRLIKTNQFDNSVPDPIVIDRNNVLINGQHRLTAINKSGESIPMYVQRGSNHDLILNLDLQRKRTIGQAAYIMESNHNQFHTKMAALMFQMYVTELKGEPFTNIKLSAKETLMIADKFTSGIRFAEKSFGRATGTIGPVKAALARAYYGETDKDKLFEFGRVYNTGMYDASIGQVPVKLEKYVNSMSRSAKYDKSREIYLATEYAIRHYMLNRQVKKIKPAEKELYPAVNQMFKSLNIKI